MYRNALCTKALAIYGESLYIGEITPAGITQCGYFIDVYTESRHVYCSRWSSCATIQRAKVLLFFDICKFFEAKKSRRLPISHKGRFLRHLVDGVEALPEDTAHLALADEGIGVDGAHEAENLGTLVLAGNGGDDLHRLFAVAALRV